MGLFDRFRKSQPIKEVTYSSREMADFLVESVPEIRRSVTRADIQVALANSRFYLVGFP
jgi:hypothetical protein